jgi:hypothetical protein
VCCDSPASLAADKSAHARALMQPRVARTHTWPDPALGGLRAPRPQAWGVSWVSRPKSPRCAHRALRVRDRPKSSSQSQSPRPRHSPAAPRNPPRLNRGDRISPRDLELPPRRHERQGGPQPAGRSRAPRTEGTELRISGDCSRDRKLREQGRLGERGRHIEGTIGRNVKAENQL